MINVGSDFSGVGAFNQALIRLGISYKEVFACDMDKYARQTFIHNYGEPDYYPENVYDREIPSKSLDIYMTSPPCQAFSLAGKRKGKEDLRGVLFFNSYEFIQVNKPRYFIFENVKGLLSDDNGNTFQEWINYLGGKSVNGLPVIFPTDEAVPYHIYWKVLNAKKLGVPQNRERVFIIGIRDDEDNVFNWPNEVHLTKKLKDVLESEVDEKYFLSEKMVQVLKHHKNPIIESENPNNSACIHAGYFKMGGRDQQYLKVKSATQKGFELATENDSINFSVPNSKTRRGRVGKEVAQTLDTACNQGVMVKPVFNDKRLNQTIEKNQLKIGEIKMLDTYNQSIHDECPALKARHAQNNDRRLWDGFKIRRLTPRECFRLMDFPDTFTWTVSDSQAYKQAGNSIVVKMLELIISKFKL
jgi:DNA (cytosine-5)-methyltransferase 1